MEKAKTNIFSHYRNLMYFTFNRFKGTQYSSMREYFASILIAEIEEYMPLENKKVVDVGGARGEICQVLEEARECHAINLEPFPDRFKCDGPVMYEKTEVALAEDMPFEDDSFDLVICRGTLEHIPKDKQPLAMKEMFRVLKKGGICYLMIPPKYTPHAGHHVRPFHYFPFKVAKALRQFFFRNKVEANSYEEEGLFLLTFGQTKKLIRQTGFKLLDTKDTHLRLHFLTKLPVLREIAVPAVAFMLTKE
jgi:ubiquinone/menaquinone biosynthesis C-methylase UbiE